MKFMANHLTLDTNITRIQDTLFDYFALEGNPFKRIFHATVAFKSAIAAIKRERMPGYMLAISAQVGAGKTTLVRLLDSVEGLLLIHPELFHQQNVSVTVLQTVIIQALRTTDKYAPITGDQSKKCRDIAELLYHRKEDGLKVILILDDSQQWQPETLRMMKRIRESVFLGKGDLINIVALGHPSALNRLESIQEVGRRFTHINLNGFTKEETIQYVEGSIGHLFADATVLQAWCESCADRRPLLIQNLLLNTLNRVMIRGGKQIEMEDIDSGLSIREGLQLHNISQNAVAKEAKVSTSAVSQVFDGTYGGTQTKIDHINAVGLELINKKAKAI